MSRSIRDLRDIVNISRLSLHGDGDLLDYSSDSDCLEETNDDEDLVEYITARPSSARLVSAFKTPLTNNGRPSTVIGSKRSVMINESTFRPQTAPLYADANNCEHNYQRCHNNDVNNNNTIDNIALQQHASFDNSKPQSFPSRYTPIPPISPRYVPSPLSEGSSQLSHHKHVPPSASSSMSVSASMLPNSAVSAPMSPNSAVFSQNGSKVRFTYGDDTEVVGVSSDEGIQVEQRRKKKDKPKPRKNFDTLFQYLDGTIIASWLEQSNKKLHIIDQFMKKGDNFLNFADFVLTKLSMGDYSQLIDLEFSIFLDHLKYGLSSGLSDGHIELSHLEMLARSVLWEYPKRFKKPIKGVKLVLDIIMVFCGGRTDAYRKLLKDIRCHSFDKQHVQWLLALRAFGLINVIIGIVKFHMRAVSKYDIDEDQFLDVINDDDVSQFDITTVIIQAVSQGFLNVLDYVFTNSKIDLSEVYDAKKRNLVSIAVAFRQCEVLHYLLKLDCKINPDARSDNGSTPLHCAIAHGDEEVTSILLENGVSVNAWNEQADGATPLHMAVMLGNVNLVHLLLSYGADTTCRMGVPATTTALSLATEMGHADIVRLLSGNTRLNNKSEKT